MNNISVIPLVLSVFLIGLFSTLTTAHGADTHLDWEYTQIEISPDPHDTKAKGHFAFSNPTKRPVKITNISAPCGCTATEADKGESPSYQPGQQGQIDFAISFSRGSGELEKLIYVTTSDGQSKRTTKLTVIIDAKPYVELVPTILFWNQGVENPDQQVAYFNTETEAPVHITDIDITGDSDAFSVEKKTVKKGRNYEIIVQPRDTTDRHKMTCTITTDFPSEDNPLTYKLSASITPSMGDSMSYNRREKGFLHKFFTGDSNNQTMIVLGLSILGGTAIGLFVLALAGKSGPDGDQDKTSEVEEPTTEG